MRRFFLTVFSFALIVFSGAASLSGADLELLRESGVADGVRYAGDRDSKTVWIPKKYMPKKNEFRGVWIALIENIDFPKTSTAKEFRAEFLDRIGRIQKAGFTAVIFQIRPMNDAVYFSKLNPISKWLTGTEGAGFTDEPAFDPLSFAIRETHKRGLEFHAWLNPYRVANGVRQKKQDYLKTLSPKNFAALHPELVLAVPSEPGKTALILNPGEPEVINYLIRTVQEVLAQYDVDAIHFDDYFYPYFDMLTLDAATWKKYGKNNISIQDWRRENVNLMVRSIHQLILLHNQTNSRRVRFGISPFGIWANSPDPKKEKPVPSRAEGSLTGGSQSYFKQYADTRKWVREGWVDYIVPQLYWSFSHRTAAYAALADWWADTVKGTNVDLYIGHGIYRHGTTPDWRNPDELANQLRFNALRSEIKGSAIFSYRRVFMPENQAQRNAAKKMIETYWKKQYHPVKDQKK